MLQEALSLSMISSVEAENGDPPVLPEQSGPVSIGSRLHTAVPSTSLQHPAPTNKILSSFLPSPSLSVPHGISQSLDIIPPTLYLESEDEMNFSPSVSPSLSSTVAGQSARGETIGDKRLLPYLRDTSDDNAGHLFPVGFSMTDPIMIDSQSQDEDDEPSGTEHCFDRDKALAKRLQEEEHRNFDSRLLCKDAHPHKMPIEREEGFVKSLTPDRNYMLSIPADSQSSQFQSVVPESFASQESQRNLTLLTAPHHQEQQQTYTGSSSFAWHSITSPERKRGREKDSVAPSPRKKVKGQVETDEELARRLQRELNGDIFLKSFDDSEPLTKSQPSTAPRVNMGQPSVDSDICFDSHVLDDEAMARKLQEEEIKQQHSHVKQTTTTAALAEFQTVMDNLSEKHFLPDYSISVDCFVQDDDEVMARKPQQEEEQEEISRQQSQANRSATTQALMSEFHQVKDDEAVARRLQEEEKELRKNHTLSQANRANTAALAKFQPVIVKARHPVKGPLWNQNHKFSTTLPETQTSSYTDEDEKLARLQRKTEFPAKSPTKGESNKFSATSLTKISSCIDEDEKLARQLKQKADCPVKDLLKSESNKFSATSPISKISSYIDEDEKLARQLQKEEELEEQGLHLASSTPNISSQSQLATKGSSQLNVLGKSVNADDNENIAQKFKQGKRMDFSVTLSLQTDEELARRLQEEEALLTDEAMKTNTSLGWTAPGTKTSDEDNDKLDISSQLEDYRKLQEKRYHSWQKNSKTPLPASKDEINPYPISTSTPKRPAMNGHQLPGRASPCSHKSKPSLQAGDSAPIFCETGSKEDWRICSPGAVPASGGTGNNSSICSTPPAERNISSMVTYGDRGIQYTSSSCSTPTAKRNIPSTAGLGDRGTDHSFFYSTPTAKRNIPFTATHGDTLNNSIDLTVCQEDVQGCSSSWNSSSLNKNRKELSSSFVLPDRNPDLQDSIDLTNDDALFSISHYHGDHTAGIGGADSSFVSQGNFSMCKPESSTLFPTFEVGRGEGSAGDGGRRNKLEDWREGAGYVHYNDVGDGDCEAGRCWKFDGDIKPTHPGFCKQKSQDAAQFGAAAPTTLTESALTPPASNVSCGQKGHNRRFERCPNYYTEKEKTRRDAVEEAQRRRAEERAKEAEERQREEEGALERLTMTRNQLQQNKEQMMQQIAVATQECATQFQSQLDDIDRLVSSKERKVKSYKARQKKQK